MNEGKAVVFCTFLKIKLSTTFCFPTIPIKYNQRILPKRMSFRLKVNCKLYQKQVKTTSDENLTRDPSCVSLFYFIFPFTVLQKLLDHHPV